MEPPSKLARREIEENKTGWFDLPYEIRRMILDTLQIRNLMKFSCCSKQCSEEVWESKNYFKEIYLAENRFRIKMYFSNKEEDNDKITVFNNYSIEFAKPAHQTITTISFKAKTFYSDNVKTIQVEKSRNEVVLEYVQMFLRRIGQNLSVFRFIVRSLMRNKIVRNVKIRNLRKLSELTVGPCPDETTCPMVMGFVDMNQLSLVKEHLAIDGMNMSLERLLKMKADHIRVCYRGLSPYDLNTYFKMWANGQLHTNFKSLKIDLYHARYPLKEGGIPFNFYGLEVRKKELQGHDILFSLKPSCKSLKHLTAWGLTTMNRMHFELQIKDNQTR